MTRRLTEEGLRKLNELMAQGLSYRDAMASAASWEDAPEATPTEQEPKPTTPPTTTPDEARDGVDAILAALAAEGIVPDDPRFGCSAEEIAALEEDANRLLPVAYAHLLARVGKARTRLISHDHIAAEYHRLRALQTKGEAFMRTNGFNLPPNAFFMLASLGDCYHYVVCGEDTRIADAIVWVAREDLDAPFVAFGSIIEMVQQLADEAKRAWDSGYFAHRPEGTSA